MPTKAILPFKGRCAFSDPPTFYGIADIIAPLSGWILKNLSMAILRDSETGLDVLGKYDVPVGLSFSLKIKKKIFFKLRRLGSGAAS